MSYQDILINLVIGYFYLSLKFQNHCSQYATYYSCKYKPILFLTMLLSSNQNIQLLKVIIYLSMLFFWGQILALRWLQKSRFELYKGFCLEIYLFFVKFAKYLKKNSLKLSHLDVEAMEITRTKWDAHKVLLWHDI